MKIRRFIPIIYFSLVIVFVPQAKTQGEGSTQETLDQSPAGPDRDTFPEQILISGNVVTENGAPAEGAAIELDCRGSVTKEAVVNPGGSFSFRLGEGVRYNQMDQDLSQTITDPFGRNSSMIPFDVGTIGTRTAKSAKKSTSSARLTGCTLRASLGGFKSSTIELGTASLSMLSNVGTIVLFPTEKVRGAKVSMTSLQAPKSAKKALEKANVALRKEQAGESEKYLKSAITIYPKYGEAWYRLGRLYQAQRRFTEARDAYMKAIEADSKFATPYVWLGLITAAEQKWQEAADFTGHALDLEPAAFPEAYYVNALANFNLKNAAQAEKSALRAELMDSTHRFPRLHLILASIFAGKDDIAGSIEELRKYIKYGPRGKVAIQQNGAAPYLDAGWDTASESQKKEMASSAKLEVRLILADALSGAGMAGQAKDELAAYLEGGDIRKVPPQLRELLTNIKFLKKDETAPPAPDEKAQTPKEQPVDYLHYSLQDQPDFEPAAGQAPIEGILGAVGNNVSGLFANLFNLSAIESVQLQRVDRKGKADQSRSFEYLYLCMGAIDKQDPYFEEFRSDSRGNEIVQLGLDEGYMLTSGFMSAPLIFHPIHQNGNSFRLLGYQKLRGRHTVVVAYAQVPERCRLKGHFSVGAKSHETFKQGIAWIDAENYQIVRLVSDLLQPVPELGLEKLRTEIDFDKVRFNQTAQEFWLPVQVVVTVNWNEKLLRNTHSYSDFKQFDVKTSQKIEKPKDAGKPSEGAADPSRPSMPPSK
jgi:tetratricopeptide (TPR) repeat protein